MRPYLTELLRWGRPGPLGERDEAELIKFIWAHHPHGHALDWISSLRLEFIGDNLGIVAAGAGGRSLRLRPRRLFSESPWARLSTATRTAIQARTRDYHETFWACRTGVMHCMVSGAVMTADSSDVDHEPPWTFSRILHVWVRENKIPHQRAEAKWQLESVPLPWERLLVQSSQHDESVFSHEPDARAWSNSFIAFHDSVARLRMIHRFSNRRILPALQRAGAREYGMEGLDDDPE
jgi:hypothetical protein